jgi:hypothetical protein
MDHELQELTHFGLKAEGLFVVCGHGARRLRALESEFKPRGA